MGKQQSKKDKALASEIIVSVSVLIITVVLIYRGLLPALINPALKGRYSSMAIELLIFPLPVYFVFLLVTRKQWFSLIMAWLIYWLWVVANYVKYSFLGSAILPADINDFDELFHEGWIVLKDILPMIATFLFLLFIAAIYFYKKDRALITMKQRQVLLFVAALIVFIYWGKGIYFPSISLEANVHNSFKQGMVHGFTKHFLTVWKNHNSIQKPDLYTRQKITAIVESKDLTSTISQAKKTNENLISLMVESFTDPVAMGWQFDRDPLPTYHRLVSKPTPNAFQAQVLSPVYGGKSVNAEFEFMTGMSLRFIPPEQKPYRLYINKPISSLPEYLVSQGFQTHAVHAVGTSLFFERVYALLKINDLYSLQKKPSTTKHAPPSSHAVLEEVIKKAKTSKKPYFIHAFPNATHQPWYGEAYGETRIRLLNKAGLSRSQVSQLEGYANALHEFDSALAELVLFLKAEPSPTTLVMLGDHQPAIADYAKWKMPTKHNEITQHVATHQVPFLIWKNHPWRQSGRPSLVRNDLVGSMNIMPSIVLQAIGIEPSGFMKFVDVVRQKAPFSSQIFFDGERFTFEIPESQRQLMHDYELLQYDLLHGKQYYYQIMQEKQNAKQLDVTQQSNTN